MFLYYIYFLDTLKKQIFELNFIVNPMIILFIEVKLLKISFPQDLRIRILSNC
jgi:hypothetical protein